MRCVLCSLAAVLLDSDGLQTEALHHNGMVAEPTSAPASSGGSAGSLSTMHRRHSVAEASYIYPNVFANDARTSKSRTVLS